jgi:hypothetical protein
MQKKIYIHAPKLVNTVPSLINILNKLAKSELSNVAVYLCHSPGYRKELEEALGGYEKLNLHYHELEHGPEFFEYPTLHKIWSDAQKEDFYCLYMHVKGASKEKDLEFRNAIAWSNYMMHAVVDNADACVQHLEQGAELVGCMWHWHFKGNFWWGDSKHLKEMPNPLEITEERYNAEYWCCLGFWWDNHNLKIPKIKNLFYLPELKTDNDFLPLSFRYPPHALSIDSKYALIDKRIDSQQPQTVDEFLKLNYKCAIDEIYMLEDDKELLDYLKYFINYDGSITLLRGDEEGSFYTLDYSGIDNPI